jgi:hypothetical protein
MSTNYITRSPKEEESSPPHRRYNDELKRRDKEYSPTIPGICRYGFKRHDPNAYTIVCNEFQQIQ